MAVGHHFGSRIGGGLYLAARREAQRAFRAPDYVVAQTDDAVRGGRNDGDVSGARVLDRGILRGGPRLQHDVGPGNREGRPIAPRGDGGPGLHAEVAGLVPFVVCVQGDGTGGGTDGAPGLDENALESDNIDVTDCGQVLELDLLRVVNIDAPGRGDGRTATHLEVAEAILIGPVGSDFHRARAAGGRQCRGKSLALAFSLALSLVFSEADVLPLDRDAVPDYRGVVHDREAQVAVTVRSGPVRFAVGPQTYDSGRRYVRADAQIPLGVGEDIPAAGHRNIQVDLVGREDDVPGRRNALAAIGAGSHKLGRGGCEVTGPSRDRAVNADSPLAGKEGHARADYRADADADSVLRIDRAGIAAERHGACGLDDGSLHHGDRALAVRIGVAGHRDAAPG